MAAATAGYEWSHSHSHSHSSPLRSSSDTASPMYPDRPIRPLPKRSLRERMSPEQAASVVFPPHPPATSPLFNFPYSSGERGNRALRQGETDHHSCQCGHNHSEAESDEESEHGAPLPASPSYHYSRSVPGKSATGGVNAYRKPGSVSSSVDGYESFENTNNKKKRKIPNSNMGNNAHHTNLLAEMASMGISRAHDAALDDGDGADRYYGSAPATPQHAGTGISGAGRGRFGRSASGRSERRVLGNSGNLANAKASSKRRGSLLGDCGLVFRPCADVYFLGPPEHQGGIISTAIANAQATPPHAAGNENVSLLQQEASKNSANKTQFTFTCGSDSANKMSWPGQENSAHGSSYPQPPGAYPASAAAPRARPPVRPDAPNVNTQGTQTSPHANGSNPHPAVRSAPPQPNAASGQQQQAQSRRPRRSASKLYALAAKRRRAQQEYTNYHNPPETPWICEFCEYEDIFGTPPLALIRQYEIKDRKERKRAAEKRRLLEKARMKGRKGKKTSKKNQNNQNNANNQAPPAGSYDRRGDDAALDDQDEEFYDNDGYDDIPHHAPAPSSARPCDHPGCHHHHHHKPPVMAPG
ncbi:hypothetical protein K458DRAFT_77707 [Lentithecium fluviatile CBS 122367]|uniref:Uncharacterized protein n=1 Tax=Lentithecium fluviatile CBS 122367 TaxID=1168545 RepID=A0A6G1ITX0_9PLEO|nr:hypothetical protein K458DRAFT_77707 [Lentithecium fluviatile CBS 122367]